MTSKSGLLKNEVSEMEPEDVENMDNAFEETQRENWSGKLEFLLSCIGYAVGLGNIWRFPYVCYRNGGAAFLIPYLTFLFLCGMPLFFMEVSLGQFASLSPLTIWRVSPLFKGIGVGMIIVSGIVCIYYNVIIAWTIYYFFKSLHFTLPWSHCTNPWNTPNCSMHMGYDINETALINGNLTFNYENFTTYANSNGSMTTNMSSAIFNTSEYAFIKPISPSEEFWEREVLQITSGIEDLGGIRWSLVGCLALAWLLVFFCLFKGIKTSGKVVYVTATAPYILLLVLLLRGITLPGAFHGLKLYLVPKWEDLLTVKVWAEAAMQMFYSVGAAWGALITMASYNKFDHNCYRDAKIVPVLHCITSILAGFVIFSIIGFLAESTGAKVEDVVTQGPGLVFVVFTGAIANMPFSQLWALLFFLMLLIVGLGTQFMMFETMSSAIIDEFPQQLRDKRTLVTAVACTVAFLLGIPCVTRGGVYVLQIMDWYSSTFSLMVLSLLECMVVAGIYGVDRFYKDIELMLGYQPCLWWKMCWSCVTPITIAFVFWFSIAYHSPVTYGAYFYPSWALSIGWCFSMCSIVPIPIVAICNIIWTDGQFLERVKILIRPTREWGPALDENRERYIASLDMTETMVLASLKTYEFDEETRLVGD